MFLFRLAPLALVLLLAAGCDSGEPDEPETPPSPAAPTFAIASRVVTLDDNSQGLQFFMTPSADVTLNLLEVRNPLGQGGAAPIQNLNILGGNTEALQDDGTAYNRVSGDWRFRFRGYLTAQGPSAPFDVTTTLSVSARVRNDSPAD